MLLRPRAPRPLSLRRRNRTRGQALVEFALVTPLLLLLFAGAADLGRAFYAYVAVENSVKEGALFGSRTPLCNAPSPTCPDPGNVLWRVQTELQTLKNPDGTKPTPTIECVAPGGAVRASLDDCLEGDTYSVSLTYQFRPLTPIISDIMGDLFLSSSSKAVVLNTAFDPSPGLSVQKLVNPVNAENDTEIIANCLEPEDSDAAGFYRSPCVNTVSPDPSDVLYVTFEQGQTIGYKLTVANTGAQSLSGVTIVDSTGSTGCSFPSTMAVGASQVCNYTRTAPVVPGAPLTMDYTNAVTGDSAQTLPAHDAVTVKSQKPPAELQVLKWVSTFKEGSDGDGNPGFGTQSSVNVGFMSGKPGEVWFKIMVTNTGGQPATGVQITDSAGALPYGQNDADAVCDLTPATLGVGAANRFECRYRVNISSAQTTTNTVNATATNVVPDSDDSATATAIAAQCTGSNLLVPNLIGLLKGPASTAWSAAGFTGSLSTWGGHNSDDVAVQSRPAFTCAAATSTMSVDYQVTP